MQFSVFNIEDFSPTLIINTSQASSTKKSGGAYPV